MKEVCGVVFEVFNEKTYFNINIFFILVVCGLFGVTKKNKEPNICSVFKFVTPHQSLGGF